MDFTLDEKRLRNLALVKYSRLFVYNNVSLVSQGILAQKTFNKLKGKSQFSLIGDQSETEIPDKSISEIFSSTLSSKQRTTNCYAPPRAKQFRYKTTSTLSSSSKRINRRLVMVTAVPSGCPSRTRTHLLNLEAFTVAVVAVGSVT